MAQPDEVLTPRGAARILHCRPETVRELCRRGELPHRVIGTRVRISRDALLAWLRGEGNGGRP